MIPALHITGWVGLRACLLLTLIAVLTAISTHLRADSSGTCGGANTSVPFNDVQGNLFFCSIAEAYFSGLTNGTSPTTYSPADSVSREQLAAFITRTLDQSIRRRSRRAALRQWWMPRDAVGLRRTDVGSSPDLIECDGADIWVTSQSASRVLRVRASDGMPLQTWTGASGALGVVFAAGQVYVTGHLNIGRVYRIDPTQPAGAASTLATMVGEFPFSITFDGKDLWTANEGSGPGTGSISRVEIPLGTVTTFTTNFSVPIGIFFDGASLWVTDAGDNTLKRVALNGTVSLTIPVQPKPLLPVFDGTNIWVPNSLSDSITVVRAASGQVVQTLTGNGLNNPVCSAFDGERVLVTNQIGSSVSLWKATDLTPLGSVSTAGIQPFGACSDGLNFWISLQASTAIARF